MTPAAEERIRAAVAGLAEAIVGALVEQDTTGGPERLLNVREVARLAGVGRTWIYAAMGRGTIRSVRIGRRRLIPASALADLADGGPEAE